MGSSEHFYIYSQMLELTQTMFARIERETQQLKHVGPPIILGYILKLKEKRREVKLALCIMNMFNIKLEQLNWNNRTGPQS